MLGIRPPTNLGKVLLIEGRIEGGGDDWCPETHWTNQKGLLEAVLLKITAACQLTVLDGCAFQFMPFGMTVLKLLGESHISIHTWPEVGAFAMDVYSCNDDFDESVVIRTIRETFAAAGVPEGALRLQSRAVLRGFP